MNRIEAREIMSFGRTILSVHIDGTPLDRLLCDRTGDSAYRDLWCAWLLNGADNPVRYLWTLLDEKRSGSLPVLLCPDDMDFWCTVLVAQVRFDAQAVTWDRIGRVTGKIDADQWRASGIQRMAAWSEADWEQYGGTLAWLDPCNKEWERWWSEN